MSWIKKVVMKWLLGDVQEKLLSKLPANGLKTVISLVVTVCVVIMAIVTGVDFAFANILEWVVSAGGAIGGKVVLSQAEIATLSTSAITLVSSWHKVLKRLKDV